MNDIKRWNGTSYLVVILALIIAVVLALPTYGTAQEETRADQAKAKVEKRGKNDILGAPKYNKQKVIRYAKAKGSTKYIMRTIPLYYKLAPKRNIAPDVLIAQSMIETGYGRYGGDSKPWNMAGIKKGNATGDEPRDFEIPPTAYEGARMHVNHMAAYTGRKPIGKPHGRYYVVRDIRAQDGTIRKISELTGTWATDPSYARKIRSVLDEMKSY